MGERFISQMFKKIVLVVALLVLIPTAVSIIANLAHISEVNSTVEGTVSDKKYIAAHTESVGFLFAYSSDFKPEKWQITLRKYDSATKKWITTDFEVDKDTYEQLKIGDHFKDSLGRSAFFKNE